MPETTGDWLFFLIGGVLFLGIILGLSVGVGANLMTDPIKRKGENWFQRRRLRREKYKNSLKNQLLLMEVDARPFYYVMGIRLLLNNTMISMGIFFSLSALIAIVIVGSGRNLAVYFLGSFGVVFIITGTMRIMRLMNYILDLASVNLDLVKQELAVVEEEE